MYFQSCFYSFKWRTFTVLLNMIFFFFFYVLQTQRFPFYLPSADYEVILESCTENFCRRWTAVLSAPVRQASLESPLVAGCSRSSLVVKSTVCYCKKGQLNFTFLYSELYFFFINYWSVIGPSQGHFTQESLRKTLPLGKVRNTTYSVFKLIIYQIRRVRRVLGQPSIEIMIYCNLNCL